MKLTMHGLDDLMATLVEQAPKEARNLARTVVHDIAIQMSKEAKSAAPVKTGTLKKAIKPRRHKPRKKNVFISSVRGNAAKKQGKIDAFYWKFIEFGTRRTAPRPFIKPIKDRYLANMPNIYRESFGRKLEQRLARAKKT